jgi:hypothetical protein
MSTGVMIIYADAEAFTFMTPQGHPLAAWDTFSAFRDGDVTVAQAHALERTADPLTELAYFFGANRYNDRFWEETLFNLARSVGVAEPAVSTEKVCVDRRRQWRYVGNVRFSPAVSMAIGVAKAPARWLRSLSGHPEKRDTGKTIAAPAPRLPTGWLTVAVGIGLVIVVAISVAIAVTFGLGQRVADGTGTTVRSQPAIGYPARYGLAGPTRVGPNAASWIGYPPHFGIAGPSPVGPNAASSIGYPPHFGLAGPSRVRMTTAPIADGAGYPLHYGLAGPSQVDEER